MIFRDESLKSAIAEAIAVAAHCSSSQLSECIYALVEELESCTCTNTDTLLLFAGAPSWIDSESLINFSKYRDDNTERQACAVHWFGHKDRPPYHTVTGKDDSPPDFQMERQHEWRWNEQAVEPDNLNWQQRTHNRWLVWKKKRPIMAAFLVILFPTLLQSCVNTAAEIAIPQEPRLGEEIATTYKIEGDQVFVINGDATFIINGVPQKEQGNMQQDKLQFGGMILDCLPENSTVTP